MIFDSIASVLGRVSRDVVEGLSGVIEEVSNIPTAFAEGFNKGLLTNAEPIDIDQETIEQNKKLFTSEEGK